MSVRGGSPHGALVLHTTTPDTGQLLMPIHARYRWFYPIDWPQLSAVIRFRRAQGKCERCGRPHGHTVCHLGDGRWWDRDKKQWRDGKGRPLPRLPALSLWKGTIRTTRVVLACSHLDHDPTNNRPSNLKAFCQRCQRLVPWLGTKFGRGPSCSFTFVPPFLASLVARP